MEPLLDGEVVVLAKWVTVSMGKALYTPLLLQPFKPGVAHSQAKQ